MYTNIEVDVLNRPWAGIMWSADDDKLFSVLGLSSIDMLINERLSIRRERGLLRSPRYAIRLGNVEIFNIFNNFFLLRYRLLLDCFMRVYI